MEQSLNLAIQEETTHEQNVDDFKKGRHLQRLAVAREFASGRPLINFIRAVGSSEHTIRNLLTEARNLGLLQGQNLCDDTGCHTQLSQALPSQAAARTFAVMTGPEKEQLKEEVDRLSDRQEAQQAKAKELIAAARARLAKKKGIESKPSQKPSPEELRERSRERELAGYRSMAREVERYIQLLGHQRDNHEVGSALQRVADRLADLGFHPHRS